MRCSECPITKLENALAEPKGELLGRALDLEFALRAGITVTYDDIPADEFLVLKMLEHERSRYEQSQQQQVKHGRV